MVQKLRHATARVMKEGATGGVLTKSEVNISLGMRKPEIVGDDPVLDGSYVE